MDLFNRKMLSIPYYRQIRDYLAHDIARVVIEDSEIVYFDKANERQEYEISKLFNLFEEYLSNL